MTESLVSSGQWSQQRSDILRSVFQKVYCFSRRNWAGGEKIHTGVSIRDQETEEGGMRHGRSQ
jgi:hypothetical protein